MPTINSIRQLRRAGCTIAEIARQCGVSRDTVYKYIEKDSFSPQPPTKKASPSKLDPYKPLIDQWLEDDKRNWRKQRHTAKRIWERLHDEEGADVGYSTVRRYVASQRSSSRAPSEQFLELVWAPGEAQADFGEADFSVYGVRQRLKYFVVTFPHSNVGLAQVFPGENAECVCEGLKRVFEYIGGVPTRVVFDNATGVGRRVCGKIRTSALFGACSAHYGFNYSFCNPDSGHEKGNVENKVGFIRRSLFVPTPMVYNIGGYNEKLLDACMELSRKEHYRRGEPERQLFVEDQFSLMGLPEAPFDPVTYERRRANKQGKLKIGGCHLYSTAPEYGGCELVVGLRAYDVEVYDKGGARICTHRREYGDVPTDTTNPASQLPLLCWKSGAWENSQVRLSLSDELRDWMDSLDDSDLRAELRMMRDESARSGWSAMLQAAELAFAATGRLDEASMAVSAARLANADRMIAYDDPIDLSEYDMAVGLSRR